MSALKLRAVLWNYKLPIVSALLAFIKANYPKIDSSSKYLTPLNILVGLGEATISG